MTCSKTFVKVALVAGVCSTVAAPAFAQRRSAGHVGGGVVRGGQIGGIAVDRPSIGRPVVVAPRIISPRVIGMAPFRPYYYYRPGIRIGFYGAFGFGYPYYYPYTYPYAYPYTYYYPYYPYPAYGYPYPAYSHPYSYPYSSSYPSYNYPPTGSYPPQGTVTAQPQASTYGGVRIEGAPRDAQVYVDGYYAGIVDDFDGSNKHLNLTSGAHQIEIRITGQQPVAFDVSVPPNQTITLRVP